MDNYLDLSIEFSKDISEKEKENFVDFLIDEIEKLEIRAGGGYNEQKISWLLDCSESSLNRGKILDRLNNSLARNESLICHYEIK